MNIVQDMWTMVMSVFGGASTISLIIMLVVVVGAGMVLHSFRRLFTVTTGAMLVFGLLSLGYSVTQGANPASLPETAWADLKQMTVGSLVVMFMAFAVVIAFVHLLSNTVGSGGGGGDH
jgi:hypothetical protein